MTRLNHQASKDQIASVNFKRDAILSMTPAQIDAWIDANVNSLADAKTLFKKLARIIRVMIRRGALD